MAGNLREGGTSSVQLVGTFRVAPLSIFPSQPSGLFLVLALSLFYLRRRRCEVLDRSELLLLRGDLNKPSILEPFNPLRSGIRRCHLTFSSGWDPHLYRKKILQDMMQYHHKINLSSVRYIIVCIAIFLVI